MNIAYKEETDELEYFEYSHQKIKDVINNESISRGQHIRKAETVDSNISTVMSRRGSLDENDINNVEGVGWMHGQIS